MSATSLGTGSSVFVLKIGQSNVNSLVRKLPIVKEFLDQQMLHILGITETHLLQSMPSSFIDIPNYSVVRNDTPGSFPKHGVCIYIHASVKFEQVTTPCHNLLSVYLTDLDVYVIIVYRPPSSSAVETELLYDFLLSFCGDKEVLVLGDFNLPTLSWKSSDPTLHASPIDRQGYEVFITLGLTQWVSEPTFPRSSNILDLVLSTEADRMGSIQVLPPLPGCDHCPVVCNYVFDLHFLPPQSVPDQCRKWHKGKYKLVLRALENVDWQFELSHRDINSMYDRFIEILVPLINDFVPISLRGQKPAKLPWNTNPPHRLRTRKKAAWDKYKCERLQFGRNSEAAKRALADFFAANNAIKQFLLKSQSEYEKHLVNDLKQSPKRFHAYLRQKKVGCPSVGPLRQADGTLTDEPSVMAESFATAFASVFSSTQPCTNKSDVPTAHQTVSCQMPPVDICAADVLASLQALDVNSASGADNLHPHLLRGCAAGLAYPLYLIFRKSLRECRLPVLWKSATVVPIFKKGSRYDALNYRPISLTSVTCKCLERLIARHLTSYLEDNNILSDHQFGFRSGRSTMDQLLLVYNDVTKCLDGGNVVDLIMFDFAKAFDVVSHPILLTKLHLLGIDIDLIRWIEDFLVGRQMQVNIQGKASRPHLVSSGVPQGSVLGPILFLVFVNNIASNLVCQYKIFADDLKMYLKIRHDSPANHAQDSQVCQRDITTLHRTAAAWCLNLNLDKCVVIRFKRKMHVLNSPCYYLDQSKIQVVQSHTDLGVLVDSDLKFHKHVTSTVCKAAGLTQNLLKSTVCRSPDFMMTLFSTHIRPIIEYCSCVWHTGYKGDLDLLESVQRRWTKRVTGLDTLDYGARLRALNQYSIQGRLLRADLIQYWKVFHAKCSIEASDLFPAAPQSSTRGHRFKIGHTRAETDIRLRSFSMRSVNRWNALPDRVVAEPNIGTFKVLLAESLGKALYAY